MSAVQTNLTKGETIMKKRLLSVLLVVVMILGMVPMAMAEEAAAETTAVTLDFNAAAASGTQLSKFTEAANGWAWYEAGSTNASPMFYNSSSWDYKVLRVKPTDANVTDLVGTVAFTAPTSGKYTMELTYAPGAIGNYTTVSVGGVTEVYYGYGSWGTEVATVTASDVVLTEGSNLMSFARAGSSGEFLIKQVTFTLVEEAEPTAVTIDFDTEYAKGKGVSQYAVSTDGWAFDAENSTNVTAQFYQNSNWSYRALRLNKGSNGDTATAAINIAVPVAGTYKMDLTYALGNSCSTTEASMGGATTSYFAYAAWGAEAQTATVHNVKLAKGTNVLSLTSSASMMLVKTVTLTLVEQDNVFGLDFDLYARSGKALDAATLETNGWAINADETTAAVDFYKFSGNANYAAWDYKVLRAFFYFKS